MKRGLLAVAAAVALSSCGVTSAKMRREDTTRIYSAPYERVFDAGLEIVRENGWAMLNASREVGFITAKSGTSWKTNSGQTVSIQFVKANDGKTEIAVSSQMNQANIQMFGWGESADFVRRIISSFDSKLRSEAAGKL